MFPESSLATHTLLCPLRIDCRGGSVTNKIDAFRTLVTVGHRVRHFNYSALRGYASPPIDFILLRIQTITVQHQGLLVTASAPLPGEIHMPSALYVCEHLLSLFMPH